MATSKAAQQRKASRADRKVSAPAGAAANDRWEQPEPLLAIFDEHRYALRLLKLLEQQVEAIGNKGNPDFECIADVMHYMTHFPDRYHHPKEDLIFERMSDVDPALAKTIAKLRRDHEKLALQGRSLYRKVTAHAASGTRRGAAKLAAEVGGYASGLRNHMRLEEREVFAVAARTLTSQDWQDINDAIQVVNDPVFGDRVARRYVSLMAQYLDGVISVASSGAFPIRVVESTLSSLERAIHTAGDLKQLPQQLTQTGYQIVRDRLEHFGELRNVQDREAFSAWFKDRMESNRSDWQRVSELCRDAINASGAPVRNSQESFTPVVLHTDDDEQVFEQSRYLPSRSPRTSWQAALMNLMFRVTLKQLMGKMTVNGAGKAQQFNRKPVVPPGTSLTPVENQSFHAEWIVPEGTSPYRTVLHLPGGGFLFPASTGHRLMAAQLARETAGRALLVNYRLLPEHPFPAGLEDALAAYRFLLDQGVDASEIVVSGDSAGGCLVLALLMSLREEGLPMPAAAALLSPLTDLTFSTEARTTNRWKDSLLPAIRKSGAYTQYAGDSPVEHPLVSPIFGDFSGLPPIIALVSSSETLLDDTLVVARKARAQGVDFDVEVWQCLPHAWPVFKFIPEGQAAIGHVASFFNDHFGTSKASARRGGKKAARARPAARRKARPAARTHGRRVRASTGTAQP